MMSKDRPLTARDKQVWRVGRKMALETELTLLA